MSYTYRGSESLEYEEAMERALQGPETQRTWPRRGQGKAQCGTIGGHSHHRKNHEPVCEPCRIIYNTTQQWRRGRPVTGRRNTKPQCGTLSGYRHNHPNQTACFKCRVAFANYMRDYRTQKQGQPA